MLARSLLCAALGAAVPGAWAGDDAAHSMMVVACNAEAINQAMVDTCARSQPQRAAEAKDALAAWRKEFGDIAQRARKQCQGAASEGPAKAEMDARLEKVLATISQSGEKDPQHCDRVLERLAADNPKTRQKEFWSGIDRTLARPAVNSVN